MDRVRNWYQREGSKGGSEGIGSAELGSGGGSEGVRWRRAREGQRASEGMMQQSEGRGGVGGSGEAQPSTLFACNGIMCVMTHITDGERNVRYAPRVSHTCPWMAVERQESGE